MDHLTAGFMGEINRGKSLMVFDWERAARLIVERKASYAAAGLRGDWEHTGGAILYDGMPVPREESEVFLASTWAVPELQVHGETIPCFRMQADTPGWDSDTYWPEEALALL